MAFQSDHLVRGCCLGSGALVGVSLEHLGRTILETVYRMVYAHLYPKARTLCEMMRREGFAGQKPRLDAEELDYTRRVIEPYRDTVD